MRTSAVGYRWVVLAVGTLAQAATSAYFQGLAGIGPALRAENGLTLGGLGLLLACPTVGIITTLLAWGPAADRYGERPVMTVGLGGAALCLVGASLTDALAARAILLVLAGAAGASVTTASGRAVLTWFPGDRRGVAMGIRQCAVPAGSGLAAAVLPSLVDGFGVHAAFLALGVLCLVAGVAVLAFIREPPASVQASVGAAVPPVVVPPVVPTAVVPPVVVPPAVVPTVADPPGRGGLATTRAAVSTRDILRDRRLWRLSGAGALLVVPQFTMIAFLVELLHDERGLSAHRAAVVLAVAQALGAAARIVTGAWSDRVGQRVRPLRTIAGGVAVGMVLAAFSVHAPTVLLAVVLVVVAGVTVCWNGLAFTAAGELAPPGRAATSMAAQNSANFVSAAVTPPLVGVLITGIGWSPAFLLIALAPVLATIMLGPLVEPRRAAGRARADEGLAA
jgi:sugar phosphate permease